MSEAGDLKDVARRIFAESLAECSVEQAFLAKVMPGAADDAYSFRLRGGGAVDLSRVKRVVVIAIGKGANPMLRAFLRHVRVPDDCRVGGVLIAPEPLEGLPEGFSFFQGGHPLPNEASFDGARAALAAVEEARVCGEETFCFFLISGGASAMMELPLDASISLEDTVGLYRALVHSGAPIAEINCVRKHFSAVKGGRLGMAAAGTPSLTMLVSDVPEGELDSLSSGPTLPDRSTVAECRGVLTEYGLLARVPAAVRRFFESDALIETPKPDAFSPDVFTLISSDDLAASAKRWAESLGYVAVVDNTCDDWDFQEAANYLLDRLERLRMEHGRVCLISAGEVTVRVPGETHGMGGRNQHFALYAATRVSTLGHRVAVFSAGSDGIDGNSPYAGAVVDEGTLRKIGVARAEDAMRRFDSAPLFEELGATVLTGPTGNNLRDLRLLLAE